MKRYFLNELIFYLLTKLYPADDLLWSWRSIAMAWKYKHPSLKLRAVLTCAQSQQGHEGGESELDRKNNYNIPNG
jgi:hypothetical protein